MHELHVAQLKTTRTYIFFFIRKKIPLLLYYYCCDQMTLTGAKVQVSHQDPISYDWETQCTLDHEKQVS